jgi:hypothetical protein
MICRKIAVPVALLLIMLTAAISGCASKNSASNNNITSNSTTSWSFIINDNQSEVVNSSLYAELINCSQPYNPSTGIPQSGGILLEYFLYYYGVYPVTSVSYNGTTYNWTSVAYQSDNDNMPLVTPNGSIYYQGSWAQVDNVNVTVTEKTNVTTLDLEPSILYALNAGVSTPGLLPNKTRQVMIIYIDALGYQRYEDSLKLGLIPNMSALGTPIKAMCVYPSFSQPNARSLMTGIAPDLTIGNFSSDLPDGETMFDILDNDGMKAAWVDAGNPLAMDVNGTIPIADTRNLTLADEEAANIAIQQYKAGANLVIVRLDSPDKAMQGKGIDSPQAEAAVSLVDVLTGEIVSNLNNGTAVILWADHGCHPTKDGEDHTTLLPDDMYIPITVHYV